MSSPSDERINVRFAYFKIDINSYNFLTGAPLESLQNVLSHFDINTAVGIGLVGESTRTQLDPCGVIRCVIILVGCQEDQMFEPG